MDASTLREEMASNGFTDVTPLLDLSSEWITVWAKTDADGDTVVEVYFESGPDTQRLGGLTYPVNSGRWHLEAVYGGSVKHSLTSDGFKIGLAWVLHENDVTA